MSYLKLAITAKEAKKSYAFPANSQPYPVGWSLEVLKGDGYKVENNIVELASATKGILTVPVRIKYKESQTDIYNLKIKVK